MILLPDIIVNNRNIQAVLSIQDPFTLNGYIITDIDMDYITADPFNGYRIKIRNENDYCLILTAEDFEPRFSSKMHEFIARYGYNANVEGRCDIYDWGNYSLNQYIHEIEEQCHKIRDNRYLGYNSYLDTLKRDVYRQGRELRQPARITSSYIRSDFMDDFQIYHYANWGQAESSLRNIILAQGSWISDWGINNQSDKNKYIHKYNYKPEYIKHYMPNENQDTTLLLGTEIEVDEGGESEEHAKKVLEIMCGVDQDNPDKALETKMYCMHDGSLKKGIEFATMPCYLEYHKNNMNYKQMFQYLDENGYKAHDTTTCGLHVHANRTYLGKTELMQQLTISKILYILEKFNDELCIIARRDNSYSRFVGNGKDEKSVVELYGKYKNQDKHVALNLKHPDTIEFRCFKGTLKYETYMLTLEFVKDIIDYAKSINIEEIELIQWSDLMNTFSDELKAYYNERLEKETKKKEVEDKKKSDAETYYDRFVDVRNIVSANEIRNRNAHICSFSTNPNDICSYRRDNPSSSLYNLLGRITSDCSVGVSIDLSTGTVTRVGEVTPVERITSEELKHKEKALKKKIKYSNNFMEKKNLEIELKEIQKEIKKEKKRSKKTA